MEVLNREIELSSVRTYIVPPTGIQQVVKLNNNGQGVYVPDKYGMHEIVLEVNEDKYVIDTTIFLILKNNAFFLSILG